MYNVELIIMINMFLALNEKKLRKRVVVISSRPNGSVTIYICAQNSMTCTSYFTMEIPIAMTASLLTDCRSVSSYKTQPHTCTRPHCVVRQEPFGF